jgi:hypothetical protein
MQAYSDKIARSKKEIFDGQASFDPSAADSLFGFSGVKSTPKSNNSFG